jgi:nuclear transport factor 2 (NTF2) superfamily protein
MNEVAPNRMKTDRVEQTEEYLKIKAEMESIIAEEFKNQEYRGLCHDVWAFQKALLKQKYNIDWQSPSELNSHIDFD